jgi:hypothetical protein
MPAETGAGQLKPGRPAVTGWNLSRYREHRLSVKWAESENAKTPGIISDLRRFAFNGSRR